MKRGSILILLFLLVVIPLKAQQISGQVVDAKTNEPLIGAVVELADGSLKTVTDVDGNFHLHVLTDVVSPLEVRYVGYQNRKIDGLRAGSFFKIKMVPDERQLQGITVTGVERKNTQIAAIQQMKNSSVIESNVSAQEISRTQDTNAGEVIRRIPGVSLIDDKFVMVRGLSQRYNNVWINGGAVPSSEADSRAFSFDMLPSSQIDNLTIVKTPTAEYPADYSGGFILINTKGIPAEDHFGISVGGNWNDETAFRNFTYSKGSSTDFLGFDSGLRSLKDGMNATLKGIGEDGGIDLQGNGLNNDWKTKAMHPLGDLKLAMSMDHHWDLDGQQLGMIAAANYTNEYPLAELNSLNKNA
ncbi:MAG: carboxypeptidase-like regulatory domain-containing protein [Prevotella sp.]|jgi:outer membrane cobalamin receptor|nr:carboxypeptidase-like regulatory domain-containing protein [Prevotella sp.]MCI2126169.1 carboxypeptidase-like regulatory domain-containing protein [Prevotella sp.]